LCCLLVVPSIADRSCNLFFSTVFFFSRCYLPSHFPSPFLTATRSCEKSRELECAASVCPADFVRENGQNACNLACVNTCPNDMFAPEEIKMQWHFFITPALIGLPLNLYATASYIVGSKGSKGVHAKTPLMLKLSAVMAVAWTCVSVIPSAALYTDAVCMYNVNVAKGNSMTCSFLRGTVHVLHCMLFWVLASVIDLYLAVVWGKTPSARADYQKFYHAWCWGIPLLMLILVRPCFEPAC
jgi:hypothetical protein